MGRARRDSRRSCPGPASDPGSGAPEGSHISVHVGDGVEAAYADAQRRGLEIVHPLTTEEWGVRRFFVRAPDGTIVNIVSHAD